MLKCWWDVWCDYPDCPLWVEGGSTREAAEKFAKSHGWKLAGGQWTCPSCQNLPSQKRGGKNG